MFGDLLDLPAEELFRFGGSCYLKGELHTALGCFHLILSTSKDKTLLIETQEMIMKCQRVLGKYRNLSLWKEMMAKEGIVAEKRACRYHSLGGQRG